jgi:hypothetical protein
MAVAVAIPPVLASIKPSPPYSRIQPQGKVAELRAELQHANKNDKNHSGKKIALKRIVANMTMSNNDMIALFPDVVNCMNIPSLEVKKMLACPCRMYSIVIRMADTSIGASYIW